YYSTHLHSPSCIFSLSLHDALPIFSYVVFSSIWHPPRGWRCRNSSPATTHSCKDISSNPMICCRTRAIKMGLLLIEITGVGWWRSEEHTSELQSRFDLVCRLLLEKK